MHRSPEEIKRDMLNNISNTEDKTENSLIHDAIGPASLEFFTANRELENVRDKLDIENLEGGELDKRVHERTGIKRKLATYATTTVKISGEENAKVPEGLTVSTGDVNFVIEETKIIGANGYVEVKAICETEGTIGNVPINSINQFPIATLGLVEVYNEKEVINGYDEENDDELRLRYYEKLQRPAKSGNDFHYEQWAKEVQGIGNARVVSTWNGPLTVKVIVIDLNGMPASEELRAKTFEHIESERPFGAIVTVKSADAKTLQISVTLQLLEGFTEAEVKNSIKENIKTYLKNIAFKTEAISYAKIGSIILDTEGVIDYSNLKINNGTANIQVGNEEVAVMGGVI